MRALSVLVAISLFACSSEEVSDASGVTWAELYKASGEEVPRSIQEETAIITLGPPPRPDEPLHKVPLAEWAAAHEIEIPVMPETEFYVAVWEYPYNGQYLTNGIIELDNDVLVNHHCHEGVLLHEIAHHWCGPHTLVDASWSFCAMRFGVPSDFLPPYPEDDVCKSAKRKLLAKELP